MVICKKPVKKNIWSDQAALFVESQTFCRGPRIPVTETTGVQMVLLSPDKVNWRICDTFSGFQMGKVMEFVFFLKYATRNSSV